MNGYVRDTLAQPAVQQKISESGAEAYGLSTAD